jgi:arginyl-tRNA--protein-N-Asp/Glu arginylyltransferase
MRAPKDDTSSGRRLAFYATPEHACSYLARRTARTLFADPNAALDNHLYSRLVLYGFRRSGEHIYRPSCPGCDACVPVRIPVADFQPNRSQRRTWRRNSDLRVRERQACYDPEHFALYRTYMSRRHPGGGMDNADPTQYEEFLTSGWSDTRFLEFRLGRQLLSVAVIDILETGFSAVYTFFDPEHARRGLGTYAILWEIERTRREGLPWLYLGYWIQESPRMRYKDQFQPLEQFREGRWLPLPAAPPDPRPATPESGVKKR